MKSAVRELGRMLRREDGQTEIGWLVWLLIAVLIFWLLLGPAIHVGAWLGGGVGVIIAVLILLALVFGL